MPDACCAPVPHLEFLLVNTAPPHQTCGPTLFAVVSRSTGASQMSILVLVEVASKDALVCFSLSIAAHSGFDLQCRSSNRARSTGLPHQQ